MQNSEGHWWRPGMDWFKPKLMTCQRNGCQNNFYQRCHTRRKYCDDCKHAIEAGKLERLLKNQEDKKK